MIEIEARREHGTYPGQNDGALAELFIESVERGMKIGKKAGFCALTLLVFMVTTATWSCRRSIVQDMMRYSYGVHPALLTCRERRCRAYADAVVIELGGVLTQPGSWAVG
jgi:hypothetical protein